MKTISQLQHEVRTVRYELSELDKKLSSIDDELSNYKDNNLQEINYERIYGLAEGEKAIRHPFTKLPQEDKSIYMAILLMIGTMEDSLNENQLMFLQRMIMSDTDRIRIDYYIGNKVKVQPETVIYKLSEYIKDNSAEILLLDIIILAKLGNNCTDKTLNTIADIATILFKDQRNVRVISCTAKCILLQNVESMNGGFGDILDIYHKFGYYLEGITGWKEKLDKAKKEEEEYNRIKISEFHGSMEEEYGDKWYYYSD